MRKKWRKLGVNGHFVEVEVKHVWIARWSLILQNTQIVFTLHHLVPFLLDDNEAVEHVVFLEIDEEVDNRLVRKINDCHKKRGKSNTLAILVRPIAIKAIEILFKIESAFFRALEIICASLSLGFDFFFKYSCKNLRTIYLPDNYVIISQIVQSRKLTRFNQRFVLVPSLALHKHIVKRNAR